MDCTVLFPTYHHWFKFYWNKAQWCGSTHWRSWIVPVSLVRTLKDCICVVARSMLCVVYISLQWFAKCMMWRRIFETYFTLYVMTSCNFDRGSERGQVWRGPSNDYSRKHFADKSTGWRLTDTIIHTCDKMKISSNCLAPLADKELPPERWRETTRNVHQSSFNYYFIGSVLWHESRTH